MKDLLKIMGVISFLISLSMGADLNPGKTEEELRQQMQKVNVGSAATDKKPEGDEDGFDVMGEEEGGSDPQPGGIKAFPLVKKPTSPNERDTSGLTVWKTACDVGNSLVGGVSSLYSAAIAKATAAKCNAAGISQDEFCSLTLQELVSFCTQYKDQNPKNFWTTFKDTKRLSRLGIFDIQFGVVLGGDDKEVHGKNFFEFLTEKVTNEPAIHFEKEMTKGRTESKTDIPEEGGEARKTIQYYSRYTNVDGKGTMIFVTLHAFRKTEKYF